MLQAFAEEIEQQAASQSSRAAEFEARLGHAEGLMKKQAAELVASLVLQADERSTRTELEQKLANAVLYKEQAAAERSSRIELEGKLAVAEQQATAERSSKNELEEKLALAEQQAAAELSSRAELEQKAAAAEQQAAAQHSNRLEREQKLAEAVDAKVGFARMAMVDKEWHHALAEATASAMEPECQAADMQQQQQQLEEVQKRSKTDQVGTINPYLELSGWVSMC